MGTTTRPDRWDHLPASSGQVVRADVVLEGGVTAERLQITALPGLGERPLLGMDVLGRLRWTQEPGVLRIDLRRP